MYEIMIERLTKSL